MQDDGIQYSKDGTGRESDMLAVPAGCQDYLVVGVGWEAGERAQE